jgi:flagellin
MAFSILNNSAGLNAQNQLNINSVSLNRTLLRLSSGKRINSGADDAAGLGIADSLRANVRALDQAVRNANDAISLAQIADGALAEMTNLLTRGFTLAEQAATETVDDAGRTALNDELTSITDEVARIAAQVNYNGVLLFDSTGLNGSLGVYVGDTAAASSISVTFAVVTSSSITIGSTSATYTGADLTSIPGAQAAITTLKDAVSAVATARASLGAGMNRLQSAVAVMANQSQNTVAAESNIRDANMAEEIANMTKYQILAQAGIAALSQANASSQTVLALLRQ